MKRMNLGCANDIKEGWTNVDRLYKSEFHGKVEIWDARNDVIKRYSDYDFILVNHVLCTMDHHDVSKILDNLYKILKPGGKVQIIDMDLLKAIHAHFSMDSSALPAEGKSIDQKLCNHVSGYGTRKSLYTPKLLVQLLIEHGFKHTQVLDESEHDLRPKESVIVEATK